MHIDSSMNLINVNLLNGKTFGVKCTEIILIATVDERTSENERMRACSPNKTTRIHLITFQFYVYV